VPGVVSVDTELRSRCPHHPRADLGPPALARAPVTSEDGGPGSGRVPDRGRGDTPSRRRRGTPGSRGAPA
jgi:hypothetical protein